MRATLCFVAVITLVLSVARGQPSKLPPSRDQVRADLLNGDSAKRQAALQWATTRQMIDASMLDAFEAAATDSNVALRAEIARSVLNPLVWSAKEQDPRAIAFAVKLAGDPDASVVHNAVYFGLSTVREPSDDVIRTMIKVAARGKSFHPAGDEGRIAWGLKSVSRVPADRLLPFFEEFWAKAEADPKPAFILLQLYQEATGQDPPNPQRFADLERRVAELDEANRQKLLAEHPTLVVAISGGDSSTRTKAFREIYSTPDLLAALDDRHLDAFVEAAKDEDKNVRREITRLVGGRWAFAKDASPKAMELLMRLARDPDAQVRYYAVYSGLSVAPKKTDDVILAMIDAALASPTYQRDLYQRIAWSMGFQKSDHARLPELFAPYLADADEKRARLAAILFMEITKEPPPSAERATADLLFAVSFGPPDGERIEPAALLDRFKKQISPDAYTEVIVMGNRGGIALTKGVAARQRLMDLVTQSPQLNGKDARKNIQLVWMPPELLPHLRLQYPTRSLSSAAGSDAKDDRRYAETFQKLYDHLGGTYPAFQIKNIDWKKVGDELLPKAKDVKDDAAFAKLVLQLVARLEDSHADVRPGSAQLPAIEFPKYDPGFACLIDDRDRPVVYHVDKGSPADSAGIKVGMTVLAVNGKSAEESMNAWMDQQRTFVGYSSQRYLRYDAAKGFCRQMKQGDVVKVELEDLAGATHTFALPATMDIRYLPRLPVPIDGIIDSGSVEAKNLGDGIGYIYVRRIRPDLESGLDAALKKLGDIKGLIIDVRGNSGGGFDPRAAVRNFNLDDTEQPDRPRFKGPIALLIDERCISAGEGWSSWFVATKRAKLFGTSTAGASSCKAPYTLSNGMFTVTVPVKAYTGSLDRRSKGAAWSRMSRCDATQKIWRRVKTRSSRPRRSI